MSKENSAVRTIALSLALILGVFIIAGIISAVISVLSLFEMDKGEYKKIYTLVDVENIDDVENLNVDISTSTIKIEEGTNFKIDTNNKSLKNEI